jgi:hypothetical protein
LVVVDDVGKMENLGALICPWEANQWIVSGFLNQNDHHLEQLNETKLTLLLKDTLKSLALIIMKKFLLW